ncbi:glycosyltransferase family protein [Thalassospira mesophila]|uniref:Membrane protein n=1 Tax=Thalassospira mesophila TaxID=1293891 RepID=A0A1Y2L1Y7_9PROT|nr:glycosyltransferase [Thalassospira mesophila]OSQ38947.1 membrane protein [Thalassospira mesophila]
MSLKGARGYRVLIYSHDTFGLGHLRRCRTIAHALVENRDDVSVLILSGSPIIGSFEFRSRVDFVRIPGVIKLSNGEYTSLNLDIDVEQMLAMRESIIQHTADVFDPDLFIVDKEPLGLRGEVEPTLKLLKDRQTRLVLGLRDVMDDPETLREEWLRKNCAPALANYYDDIWVYGLREICNPLAGIDLAPGVEEKMTYTGYLPRTATRKPAPEHGSLGLDEPYFLVTTGGGGDGVNLVDWVISAYEADPDIPMPSLVVLGPFMAPADQQKFMERAETIDKLSLITFDANVEMLMSRSSGVIAMGGYNTFCEILSFDKPSIIVPRTVPRLEQYVRASQAEKLGLVRMLTEEGGRPPLEMAQALRGLAAQPSPSSVTVPGLMGGLDTVSSMVEQWLPREIIDAEYATA